ncbi:laccase-25-like [Pecten maximus]|uniref:laccase-25-like n=1 Tax=Pecten maximus TaxID=6579 RepID=UPI001457F185|nr:laccase-25-like [Pecten maximus]
MVTINSKVKMGFNGFILAVLLTLTGASLGYECDKSATVCETTLIIRHRLTMMHPTEQQVYPANGKLYKYDDLTQSTAIPVDEVMTADGWEDNRLVVVANESLPGPPIIVYEGQRLKVHVINKMASDTLTIHWHGIPQKLSPWMDGVPFVTQCPILSGQTFTYDFIAEPKGTYWYHSHVGDQRAKGMNGAFIIRERTSSVSEQIMTVQDWNHNWGADMDHQKLLLGTFVNRIPEPLRNSVDGGLFDPFYVTSVLINGRSRYYNKSGQHNEAPLSVFSVERGTTYRFRVIHVGALYPIRISIDKHPLTLVASDGYDFQPVEAESFIINPGERYDFNINTDQVTGNYWIRAETLEVNAHKSEAVLRYTGADANQYPSTVRKTCTPADRCLVVNCPFTTYPADHHTDCLRFDHLRSAVNNDPAPEPTSMDMFKEHFLNFGLPEEISSVNGREFRVPTVSALTQPLEITSTCDKEDCGEDKTCTCTYSLTTYHNDVVQLVLMNMGAGTGDAHPVHLHGYSFYVLKMGYATYNMTTSKFISQNNDIDCRGSGDMTTSFCNDATWRNSNWLENNVPGLNLINPPRKDTLIIPSGGYAVIRIKADNPGAWMFHCHIQVHGVFGMRMLLNSSYGMHPAPPKSFPVCHEYPSSFREQFEDQRQVTPTTGTVIDDGGYGIKTFWIMFAVMAVIIILLIAYNIYVRRKVQVYKEQLESSSPATISSKENPVFSKT